MADDLQVAADQTTTPAVEKPAKKAAAKKTAAKKTTAKKSSTAKTAAKKTAAEPAAEPTADHVVAADEQLDLGVAPAEKPAKKAAAKKTAAKKTAAKKSSAAKTASAEPVSAEESAEAPHGDPVAPAATSVLFQAPEATQSPRRRTRKTAEAAPEADEAESTEATDEPKQPAKKAAAKKTAAKKTAAKKTAPAAADAAAEDEAELVDGETEADGETDGEGTAPRRRRRRGGRRRRKPGDGGADAAGESDDAVESGDEDETAAEDESGEAGTEGESASSRRRRRRRRAGEDGGDAKDDDPEKTVTRVRRQRSPEDEITAVSGSTRLEAKKQRRREGREAGRRRAPIVSEAEFLARRESVDRVMVIRQREDLIQIGVLEDRVLVEHYVARESQTSLIGNVYLGRVQNVLPSMEAAFIDIGKGRNAVLYAGEVNWSALGHKEGQPRKIESVLSSGQSVLVQVTKDPVGHKGARLTSQVSLAGRFLVYVPDGTTSGISRKLPDTERNRLKTLLKEIVPDTAGVIVRTAAEGASEDELTRDVERLKARWEDIEAKAKGSAPQLLYGEPDLTLKVVRDLFTEDFAKLVIQGDDAWETVRGYVEHVAPDLQDRLVRYDPGTDGQGGKADVFAEYRIEEQISKGLDRKVWLPSGGSLIIDRTEAMTVVDVNTGKFTGSGGNLEETVTKNNLEAAEEIVRQLRLRDIGGIIVVDFIDMVLESNRDLVLRRLVECLGRDRTRHQVAEVTSLGLVQMTRKRIGTGLLEAFSHTCDHCQGRGVVIHEAPVEAKRSEDDSRRGGRRGGSGRRGRGQDGDNGDQADKPADKPSGKQAGKQADKPADKPADKQADKQADTSAPSPKVVAAMARAESAEEAPEQPAIEPAEEVVAEEVVAEEVVAEEVVAEPAAPKVVTRSRRRSSSRPAGEPVAAEPQPEPQPEPQSEPEVEAEVQAEVQPEPEPVVETSVTPEPPKVITRTRGQRATRPAGPPAHEVAAEGSANAPVDGEAEAPHVEHVPIKKKGSRKR